MTFHRLRGFANGIPNESNANVRFGVLYVTEVRTVVDPYDDLVALSSRSNAGAKPGCRWVGSSAPAHPLDQFQPCKDSPDVPIIKQPRPVIESSSPETNGSRPLISRARLSRGQCLCKAALAAGNSPLRLSAWNTRPVNSMLPTCGLVSLGCSVFG